MSAAAADDGTAPKISLTRSAFWLFAARTITFAFSVALPLLLVRNIDQRTFGIYKQAFLLVTTAAAVFPLGIGMSVYYFFPRHPNERGAIVSNIVVTLTTIGFFVCGLFIAVPSFPASLFQESELAGLAPLLGALILLTLTGSFLDSLVIANQDVRVGSIILVVSQLVRTGSLIAAALVYQTVAALIAAALLHAALQVAVLFWYCRTRIRGMSWGDDGRILKAQLSYSLPYGVAAILYTLQTDLHNYVVSQRFGTVAFAIYSVGCFQLPFVGILADTVCSVLLPRMNSLRAQNQRAEIIRVLSIGMCRLALVFFPLYALLMVVAREFIVFLFTSEYASSVPVFLVNLSTLPFSILIFDPVFRAYAENRGFVVRLQTAMLAVMAAAFWVIGDRGGLMGIISVVVVINIVHSVLSSIKSARVLNLTAEDLRAFRRLVRIALCAAGAAGATWAAKLLISGMPAGVILFMTGSVFCIIYLTGLWTTGALDNKERDYVQSRLSLVWPF